MPTNAFYNLKLPKQQAFIDAGISVFSNYDYEHVSISKIAHTAKMPRTCFYYYFIDKKDYFTYIVKALEKEFLDTLVKKEKIDYFDFLNYLYEHLISLKNTKYEKFICRFSTNLNAIIPSVISDIKDDLNKIEFLKAMISFKKYYFENEKDQCNFISITLLSLLMIVIKYYKDYEDLDNANQQIKNLFLMFNNGCLNKKDMTEGEY